MMNSSAAVVDGGALISAGRPGGGDETKRSQGEGCPGALLLLGGGMFGYTSRLLLVL